MPITNLLPLAPFFVLSGTIILSLFTSAFSIKTSNTTYGLTLAGIAVSFGILFLPIPYAQITPLIAMDTYAAYYLGVILLSSFGIALLSHDYLPLKKTEATHEYYLILLLATLGACVLVASTHFASFLLGLEILSISLYALISYSREDLRGLEAGTKYLVLAGTSSALLLFGMALTYASTGTLEFGRLANSLPQNPNLQSVLSLGGAMILTGIGFKLALAPFHIWSPDIYEGAPAPIAAFVATVSKGSIFALLLRFLLALRLAPDSRVFSLLAILASASILIGNLTALRQSNIKRILAYSSTAHLGYLLVPILAGVSSGLHASTFYLVSYMITSLIAFSVISLLSTPERDADQISDYLGLFWKRPGVATLFSASLLSLAGMPLTLGFVGKLYLITAAVNSALWVPVAILIGGSAIGLYYYLKIILSVFTPSPDSNLVQKPFSIPARSTLLILSGALLGLGIYPSPLLMLIQRTLENLPQ